MNRNFEEKIESIENLLQHWSYRYLSPFGKVTIIKSLALSKLSHIALVIPNPTKQMFKRIETAFFKFLWGGKSEKVSRQDSKLPVKMGGLGMPDVEKFWCAFKFSWLRRLLLTHSYWPEIVCHQISKIHQSRVSPSEILQFGPSYLCKIGKKVKNKFWSEVLASTVHISEGQTFYSPEKILFGSFWYNPNIKRNNKIIRFEDFPKLANKINVLADFYYPSTNKFMSLEDFQTRYNIDFDVLKFIDIRYFINLALQKLKFPSHKLICANYPLKPTLIDIALSTNKGCSAYSKLLSLKQSFKSKISLRDEKWHAELQCRFSVDFWDKSRKLYSSRNH